MMRRIDVHSHLLPGVDDGCKTVGESIECARMLVSAGYSHCFCTPHVWPSLPGQTRQTVAQWTQDLQTALDTAGVPLKLLPGSELNLHPKVHETPIEQIITAGLNRRHILVDMWADRLPDWFGSAIEWLQGMNLTVIMAHPERMRAFQDDPSLADRVAEMGVLLQGNLQCLADRPDSHTRRTVERYLIEDRYFLLGSDTHNPAGLDHRLQGMSNGIDLVGEEVIDRLTKLNPRQLLDKV